MNRGRRIALGAGASALVLGLAAAVGMVAYRKSGWSVSGDTAAAVAAAKAGYAEKSGKSAGGVNRAHVWPTCAVVELTGIPTTGVVSVLVTKSAGEWRTARIADSVSSFDPDDIYSAGDCQKLARSLEQR